MESSILGIVGESGSGKSVTALSIMKLLESPPAQYPNGKILFKSDEVTKDLLKMSESEIRAIRGKEISMIFQNPSTSLNPSHRCGHQVREALLLHTDMSKSEADMEVLSLFEQVDLPEPQRIYSAYPHMLSGGQIQRVMIAMAISCKPKIIIADEPTTALDVTVQKTIISLLKNLQAKHGCAIIFISHDLGVINEIADEVLVMYQGNIVEKGSTRSMFLHAKDPYTKGLIACRPPLDRNTERLATVSDFLDSEGFDIDEFNQKHAISALDTKQRNLELDSRPHILEVSNLQKYYIKRRNWYGKATSFTKAVDNISFHVKQGETLGLVGESGSGKSTLGMSVVRMLDDVRGKVVFDGKELLSLDNKAMRLTRKDIQVIFQDPYSALNPRMKIGNAIKEPMDVHDIHHKSERKQKTLELLELVGLSPDHYDRYPHQFSGGQRQRISIARTLAVQPKFIICDESVSALDVSVQAQILNLLKDLQKQFGLTYLFISHDLSVIRFISDRIMVMKEGKVVEIGYTDEILDHPKTEYTQNLLASVPVLKY